MAYDFAEAGHLPNVRRGRPADPSELPRQRRGTTPQMHGRYPDYDVLAQARHWDPLTRSKVLSRVHEVPPLRFFDSQEAAALSVLCDLLTAQDREPRIPLLNYIDEKLFEGQLDGFQYEDMPDDRDTWRIVAAAIDAAARTRTGASTFAEADTATQHEITSDLAEGRLEDGAMSTLNPARAFKVVMRCVLEAFYGHPWSWNEIGFGGPAFPRGYSRFGSLHLQAAEREPWEGREAFDEDPVEHRREPPPR